MAKIASLNGSEIAGFIQERQAASVRSMKLKPLLAIVRTDVSPITDRYLRIKQSYADAIGVNVEVHQTTELKAEEVIGDLNERVDVHGIIVQLPLKDATQTERLLQLVSQEKDVDGLTKGSKFDPATPIAILWLLASYNIDLRGKRVLVIGQGRLVGAPLTAMLLQSGVEVSTADDSTENINELCKNSDIIISAAGSAGLVTSKMVPPDAVVIDAGMSTENGEVIGDVADDVRLRKDVSVTPKIGGVGPLTVAALYENLLQAARVQHHE